MNKFLFVIGLMMCFYFTGYSQRFHAGVIGGVSTTQVAGDQLSGFNKAGVVVGGFVNAPVSDNSSLQMEIIFIQKGSRKPLQPDKDNSFYVMRLSYFEVPLLFKWQASTKFNVEFGPSFAALVFSEEENEFGIYQPNLYGPFKSVDFSGNIGLSYPLSEKLNVNLRYSNSIIPIRDFPMGYSFAFFNKGQYNTVLAFTLHYQF